MLKRAIGEGEIYDCGGGPNGAHQVYVSASPAYPKEEIDRDLKRTGIAAMMLDELLQFIDDGLLCILKMDIEGNEVSVFNHRPSMEFLKRMDYFVIELHYYSHDASQQEIAKEIINNALVEFEETHYIDRWRDYLYATKKK